MKDIINFLKSHKYYLVVAILVFTSIVLSVTFSSYIVTSNDHKAAEMYIGELKYSISIDSNETNTITVPSGETIIDLNVNNLNPVDTYYKLLYLNNSNITIKYYNETKDTSDTVTNYSNPNSSITSNNTNNLKLLLMNNSTTSQNVSFSLKGGYINNTLSDIKVPSGYSEITVIETPSSNTYFCKTNSTLIQGLEYINGQYTYKYMQEGTNSTSGLSWSNITTDGWGVQLTDKTSTSAVTSKLCTYINNKPITSYSLMFNNSKATTLDVSNFDTSKVTNMVGMFQSSQATTLDLSSFDTSKVTNMRLMFSNSQAKTLDLSSFDTRKVTDMSRMFQNSQVTTLDLSSFDTSKVTSMNQMFYNSTKIKNIYVSNKFNTTAVNYSTNMFSGCTNLVGGSGTKYNSSYVDKTYAHIDGGTSNPGYFTDIAEKDFPTKAGIYIRNSSPKGLETVSRDGLYRFVGSSNNYVSMGGVSYRIIGITDDSEINSNLGIEANQLKLIKTTPIEKKEWVSDGTTDYPWGATSNTLYWYLQQDILSNTSYIPSSWNSKISLVNWYIGDTKTGSVSSISSSERSTVTSKQSKLGLMYLSDYFYSNVAGGTTNCYTTKCSRSWLNNSSKTQWTMSRYGAISNMGYFAWTIETTYNNSPLKVNNTSAYYSPVFFLDKTIYISGGSGTSSDPFILEYNKDYYFVTVYLTGNYYGLYRVKKGNEINLSIYSGNPLKYSTCSNAKYSLSVDSNKINHITIKSITDDAYCYLEYNF